MLITYHPTHKQLAGQHRQEIMTTKHRPEAAPRKIRSFNFYRFGAVATVAIVAFGIGNESSSEALHPDKVPVKVTENVSCTPYGIQEVPANRIHRDYASIISQIVTVEAVCDDEAKVIADWQFDGLEGVKNYDYSDRDFLRMPQYLLPDGMTLDELQASQQ